MKSWWWLIGVVLIVVLFAAELALGTVKIPLDQLWSILFGDGGDKGSWDTIVCESRLPRAISAICGGLGLAISGLLMQTYFRNALAGPSVLGLSSGASLGVAILVLATGSTAGLFTMTGLGLTMSIALAATVGSALILLIVMAVANRFASTTSLLIFGLMIGYITSAVVATLQFGASKESLQIFVLWGLGSFAKVYNDGLYVLVISVLLGLVGSLSILRYLNPLLLGREAAQTMGVPVKRVNVILLSVAGLLAGSITAFCGPIAFLGLAVPHLTRGIVKSADHKILLPATAMFGAILGLLCDLITRLPIFGDPLPLNAVTCLVGAPVVIWLILRNRRSGSLV